MNILGKKGDLKRVLMILIVGLLLFFVVNGILSFAETPEEEKVRLEGELAQLEQELSAIDVGKWVNISTQDDPCKVSLIKYINYNCDGSIGYREYLIKRIEKIKARLKVLEEGEYNNPSNNSTDIILLLAFRIKRKKRAQQSPTSLLNLSSSLHPEAISLKFRYVYKFFVYFLNFVILAYNSLKSYHQTLDSIVLIKSKEAEF